MISQNPRNISFNPIGIPKVVPKNGVVIARRAPRIPHTEINRGTSHVLYKNE